MYKKFASIFLMVSLSLLLNFSFAVDVYPDTLNDAVAKYDELVASVDATSSTVDCINATFDVAENIEMIYDSIFVDSNFQNARASYTDYFMHSYAISPTNIQVNVYFYNAVSDTCPFYFMPFYDESSPYFIFDFCNRSGQSISYKQLTYSVKLDTYSATYVSASNSSIKNSGCFYNKQIFYNTPYYKYQSLNDLFATIYSSQGDVYYTKKYNGNIDYTNCSLFSLVKEVPSMQNPFSEEEIQSLLDELLASEAVTHRPEGYDKFYIRYDSTLSAYFAYFLPAEVTLEGTIKTTEITDFENNVYAISGRKEESFWDKVFDDSTYLNFDYYILWKGTYVNAPTWDIYIPEYKNNFYIRDFWFDCITQPIIYTSHYIPFVIYGTVEEDELNSLTPSTDVNLPDKVENEDPNILMFVGSLLRVIYALFNVLVRFIAFITTLMGIPADSSLLLPEFVQGIDWIKALDINGISIFAFFQISIIIAFGIGVVKFIKESFAE